jgi:hypothetical protein
VSADDKAVLEESARLLWERRITEGEFLKRTAPRWRAISAGIHRRYRARLPAWVERDDVEQILVLQALHHLPRWRPDGGTTIGSFVTYCATHRTHRQMDKLRGASTSGNSGKNPGRTEITFSRLDGGRDDGAVEDFGTRQAVESLDPVEHIDSERDFEMAMRRCRTVRQAFVAIALRAAGGDVDGAAGILMRNTRMKVECGFLRDDAHAVRVVRDVIEEMLDEIELPEPIAPEVLRAAAEYEEIFGAATGTR